MKTRQGITGPWEAVQAGVTAIQVDDSVIDQLLRGSREVYEELLALLDQNIRLQRFQPTDDGSDTEQLRRAVEAEMEMSPSIPPGPQLLWSIRSSLHRRAQTAETLGLGLYEPTIILKPTGTSMTGAAALRTAIQVGAVSRGRRLHLVEPEKTLIGLH